MLRSLTAFIAACALVTCLYLYIKGLHLIFATVLALGCAPVLARLLSPVVMGAVAAIADAGRRSAHQRYQGNYYNFEGRQVRLFLVDGTVWIPEADVARLLAPPPGERELRLLDAHYATIPGQKFKGCTEAGMLQLLKARTDHRRATRDMLHLKSWLERDAFPNVKRLRQSSSA